MFVKVSRTPIGTGNKGSCTMLVNYLEKEQEGEFRDRDNNVVDADFVQKSLDAHSKTCGLKNSDAKFYMITISPSKDELQHLIGREVSDINELSTTEKQKLNENLNKFTGNVMDEYAKTFQRSDRGINSKNDLIYFSRIEQEREYKSSDNNVKKGLAKIGDKKEGLQTHIHVIVSRISADEKTLLSPLIKGGEKRNLHQFDYKADLGFNQIDWKVNCTENFNKTFQYEPKDYTTNNLYQQQEKYGSKNDNLVNDVSNQVSHKIKSEAIQKTGSSLSQHLSTEKKIADGAKKAIMATTNPKAAVLEALKTAVKKIFSSGMEM